MFPAIDYQEVRKRFEETRERLQKKLTRHSGELIVAVSRDYEKFRMKTHGPVTSYHVEELLEAGVIGKEAAFGELTGDFKPFVSELESVAYQHHGGSFLLKEARGFWGINCKGLLYLADMDEPPELPKLSLDDFEDGGCFGNSKFKPRPMIPRTPMIHETKDSRLELYIGNSMAVPYLRGSLNPQQIEQISKLLKKELAR